MTKGVFSWYDNELRVCTMNGFPACSEILEENGEWKLLQGPTDPETDEEKELARFVELVNADFQTRAKEIFGNDPGVNLPGSEVDPNKRELRILVYNDGFHLNLLRNDCPNAIDLEKVIKAGQKALQEEGVQTIMGK